MPSPKELAQALSHQGEIRNQPQNRFLGAVADVLKPVSEFLDRDKISDRIPFLGGLSAADLTGVKGTESLVRDMSYGTPPIRGATLNTVKVDPRLVDVAGLGGAMIPVAKNLTKAALREGARQIETGTGIIGRNTLDPRTRMFAGEGAKTADKQALKVAKDMQAAGVPDETIHAKTGWTLGFPDKKPRFEIDDSAAAYRPGAVRAKVNEANHQMYDESVHATQLRNIMDEQGIGVGDAKAIFREKFGREPMQGAGVGAKYSEAWQLKANEDEYYKRLMSGDVSGRTDEFLNHPELYKGYPDTGTMPTQITGNMQNKGFGGEFTGTSVKLNPDYAYGMESGKSIQLHELQHAIQQREGFARGGSPEQFSLVRPTVDKIDFSAISPIMEKYGIPGDDLNDDAFSMLNSLYTKAREKGAKNTELEEILKQQDKIMDLTDKALSPYEQYRRLSGEAEARLTQSRMNMTAAQRAASYPPSMFDVPVKDQIVRYGDGQAMSVPKTSAGLFDTTGLENQGRELIQGKAEELAQRMRDAGVNVDLQHSGSAAGPSSYLRVAGMPDIRLSGHSKGVFNSQGVINVATPDEFAAVVAQAAKNQSALNNQISKMSQSYEQGAIPIRLASADKKLAKGKSLTKSEQGAVDWRNSQAMSVPERNGVGGAMIQRPKTEFEILHDTAQRNAALPVEQGGLGLPAGNTYIDRANAPGMFPEDAVHFSRAGGDYTTLDSGKYAIAPFDAVGTHVGTPQAAMERFENTVGYKVNDPNYINDELKGASYPVRISNSKPLMNQNGMPFGEEDLNTLLRQAGGHNSPDISGGDRELNAKLRKKLFEDQGYTNIPYFNEVEGKGSVSQIVPPANIRSRFAAFDPMRRHEADILAGVGVGGMLDPQAIAEALRQQDRK